jgi:predicted DNA binding CopG/RHH family protein
MKKPIPKFMNEDEERDFWSDNDSTDFVNWNSAEKVTLANLKPSTRKISLRLPEIMIEELKILANKRDVPYQSLVKVFLADRIAKELGSLGH